MKLAPIKVAISTCFISMFSGCALINNISITQPPEYLPHRLGEVEEIKDQTLSKFAECAILSDYSYHNPSRIQFDLELLGWTLVDVEGVQITEIAQNGLPIESAKNEKSGFACDIFERKGQEGKVQTIIAYRGTDQKRDWRTGNLAIGISSQYRQANRVYLEYANNNPNKIDISVTGHSLGGGLALGVSLRHGVDAIVFDTSPRVFDGSPDKKEPAERIVIYQHGEILQKVRANWHKTWEVIELDNFYVTSYDFGENAKGPTALHSGTKLAYRLAEDASKSSLPMKNVVSTAKNVEQVFGEIVSETTPVWEVK